MTPQQQNIAIFESQGWVPVPPVKRTSAFIVYPENLTRWKKGRKYAYADEVPNYVEDLNAMHEAELELNTPKNMQRHAWNNYRARLDEVTAGSGFHATASQRAEAYLKTLNLWTP